MNTWRSASLAVTAAAALVLTAACGQERTGDSPRERAEGSGRDAADGSYGSGGSYGDDAESRARQAAAKPAGRLAVREIGGLGRVVTDEAGFTLYRFDRDSASPPGSTCDGACAAAWPPVAADGASAGPGADGSLIGEVTRSDGGKQLTLGGRPVYRFAEDAEPGDAKGQGVGGAWFAAAPDGTKAAAAEGSRAGGAGDGQDAERRPAGSVGLSTRKDPRLGEIVVDRNGRTVYRFTKDSARPMKTACTGDCLKKWPVVAPVRKNDTKGIRKKGFVTFERPDGVEQQTIDCRPLYTFAGDTRPGETNGQGVGGAWFAVSPQGKLVGAPA
ncbi:SCO0930 family lipoprotein [Streptomyces sp. NPDC014894]|uniref:SCO0930 family lipoprotein n=1 Tax=unclassified Streptomyces TaxID=2593676 RepID=UPI0036F70DE5